MPYGMNTERLAVLLDFASVTGDVLAPSQQFGSGAIEVETGLFLYSLVRRMRPRLVVETGTHWGYSGAWIASAIADNADVYPEYPGRLVTIDCNAYQERAEARWERLGVANFVTRYIGESNKWDVPVEVKDIDLLWLDSDHAAEQVWGEWDCLAPRLAPDAVVVFHDTWLDPRVSEGIRTIIEEKRGPCGQTNFSHWRFPNMRGLDLLCFGKYGRGLDV
jgi:predicted O-methyltransferase YrrM